jgi:hypothetical protein
MLKRRGRRWSMRKKWEAAGQVHKMHCGGGGGGSRGSTSWRVLIDLMAPIYSSVILLLARLEVLFSLLLCAHPRQQAFGSISCWATAACPRRTDECDADEDEEEDHACSAS